MFDKTAVEAQAKIATYEATAGSVIAVAGTRIVRFEWPSVRGEIQQSRRFQRISPESRSVTQLYAFVPISPQTRP